MVALAFLGPATGAGLIGRCVATLGNILGDLMLVTAGMMLFSRLILLLAGATKTSAGGSEPAKD